MGARRDTRPCWPRSCRRYGGSRRWRAAAAPARPMRRTRPSRAPPGPAARQPEVSVRPLIYIIPRHTMGLAPCSRVARRAPAAREAQEQNGGYMEVVGNVSEHVITIPELLAFRGPPLRICKGMGTPQVTNTFVVCDTGHNPQFVMPSLTRHNTGAPQQRGNPPAENGLAQSHQRWQPLRARRRRPHRARRRLPTRHQAGHQLRCVRLLRGRPWCEADANASIPCSLRVYLSLSTKAVRMLRLPKPVGALAATNQYVLAQQPIAAMPSTKSSSNIVLCKVPPRPCNPSARVTAWSCRERPQPAAQRLLPFLQSVRRAKQPPARPQPHWQMPWRPCGRPARRRPPAPRARPRARTARFPTARL